VESLRLGSGNSFRHSPINIPARLADRLPLLIKKPFRFVARVAPALDSGLQTQADAVIRAAALTDRRFRLRLWFCDLPEMGSVFRLGGCDEEQQQYQSQSCHVSPQFFCLNAATFAPSEFIRDALAVTIFCAS